MQDRTGGKHARVGMNVLDCTSDRCAGESRFVFSQLGPCIAFVHPRIDLTPANELHCHHWTAHTPHQGSQPNGQTRKPVGHNLDSNRKSNDEWMAQNFHGMLFGQHIVNVLRLDQAAATHHLECNWGIFAHVAHHRHRSKASLAQVGHPLQIGESEQRIGVGVVLLLQLQVQQQLLGQHAFLFSFPRIRQHDAQAGRRRLHRGGVQLVAERSQLPEDISGAK
eukprot:1058161-Prymnesium_polylepis.4